MKKTLLTLGSIAAVAVPVVTVVSCGEEEIVFNNDISENTKRQIRWKDLFYYYAQPADIKINLWSELNKKTIPQINNNLLKDVTSVINHWGITDKSINIPTDMSPQEGGLYYHMISRMKKFKTDIINLENLVESNKGTTNKDILDEITGIRDSIKDIDTSALLGGKYTDVIKWLQSITDTTPKHYYTLIKHHGYSLKTWFRKETGLEKGHPEYAHPEVKPITHTLQTIWLYITFSHDRANDILNMIRKIVGWTQAKGGK